MWFNSKQREEPYQVLTSSDTPRDRTFPFGGQSDRWCMVVVSSRREMLGSGPQRAQPLFLVASIQLGTLRRLPVTNMRKVAMTSNQQAPYVLGYTRARMD